MKPIKFFLLIVASFLLVSCGKETVGIRERTLELMEYYSLLGNDVEFVLDEKQ